MPIRTLKIPKTKTSQQKEKYEKSSKQEGKSSLKTHMKIIAQEKHDVR